jgi:hypothetical protein
MTCCTLVELMRWSKLYSNLIRMSLVDKVEQGLNDIQKGNTFTTEEVLKQIDDCI